MNSTNSPKMRLLVHIEPTGKYSQRLAFAITNAEDGEIAKHLAGANLTPSDMTVVSTGLDKDVYEMFTTYAGKKFQTQHNTVRDVQDLWVVWAKDHGVSSPQDTDYAKKDNAGSGYGTTTDTKTFSANSNVNSDANIPSGSSDGANTSGLPNTAKDNSHPIHDDVFVPYDDKISGQFINNALGISDARAKILGDYIKEQLIDNHDNPTNEGAVNVAAVISNASKIATTHAELLFIGYIAGANIEQFRGGNFGRLSGRGLPDGLKELLDELRVSLGRKDK